MASTVVIALVALLAWVVGRAIYHLYFSPLAGFPGPKLAAFTRLYELYYDGVRKGQFTYAIEKMHQKSGNVYCISPSPRVSWTVHDG